MISIHAPRTGSDKVKIGTTVNVIGFQSTLPARGATTFRLWKQSGKGISIHAPRTGSDGCKVHHSDERAISIHAPRTGSDKDFLRKKQQVDISIHAPRTGSDCRLGRGANRAGNFNPRSPHGERQDGRIHQRGRGKFQSTLPARGATCFVQDSCTPALYFNPRSPHGERRLLQGRENYRLYFNPRSPHGERRTKHFYNEGGSRFQSTLPARGATILKASYLSRCTFQSTLPARGATTGVKSNPTGGTYFNPRSPHGERHFWKMAMLTWHISIHAPRTGSDAPGFVFQKAGGLISIHAPRTGSDGGTGNELRDHRNFNPRSPHGERHSDFITLLPTAEFQSTLPARGATFCPKFLYASLVFQSTLPARGATVGSHLHLERSCIFQSTLPARGATMRIYAHLTEKKISIHAPRTGSDFVLFSYLNKERISIHAPRTGSDLSAKSTANPPLAFQSTLPARGATIC